MGNIKNNFYNLIVRKNQKVCYEYERYVMEHTVEHYEHRLLHWKILFKLFWHYRVKKSEKPLLYWEETNTNKEFNQTSSKDAIVTKEQPSNNAKNKFKSPVFSRNKAHWFINLLLPYDIVSFDIFDTLLFRPFDNPNKLFMMIGNHLDILGFYNIRINAEKEARDLHFAKYGNREVTIYDIYKIISLKTGLDIDVGVTTEFEYELKYCYSNPYMKRVYDILKYQKKTIVATSDMYLPREMIEKLLLKNGYDYFNDIIVSCEYKCNKSNGSLFEIIKNKHINTTKQTIVHVGDNPNGDIDKAKEHGIEAVYYKNCNEIKNSKVKENMSTLMGSAYLGVVNNYLYNGIKNYSAAFEYGFSVGGLYILGYCNWIHNFAKTHFCDKIIFVARDGDIYQKVYNEYFDDINNVYLYWSRISSELAGAKYDRMSFINRFINEKITAKIPISVKDLFVSIGIEDLLKHISRYGISEYMPVCGENRKSLTNMFVEHWDEILKLLKSKSDGMIQYLNNQIGESKKIILVDVGWTGTNIIKLKKMIQCEVNKDIEVYCLVAGYTSIANESLELKQEVSAYLFSSCSNHEMFKAHHASKKPINNLFEILTQAVSPSFIGIEENNFLFDFPEVENQSIIKEVQSGVLEFTRIWKKLFDEEQFMFNISGNDAYQPFLEKTKNLGYFTDNFGEFVVSMKVMSNKNYHKMETISQIL